jgi:pyrimidine-nucleoside phosphorylase
VSPTAGLTFCIFAAVFKKGGFFIKRKGCVVLMLMREIIRKKRDGEALTDAEIAFFIRGYLNGKIRDFEASALLMAICFQGMDERETLTLTLEMARSGEQLDLSSLSGVAADKHSTGGVGDKTTLIVAPLVAAMGGRVAKMSGRGLGHTGGTIDKLEAIPGFQTSLSRKRFLRQVEEIGLCVAGQTGELAPADKALYSLRDATSTVESIPLIASSIMSKKLAAGAQCIVLDVKCGSGAFMKTEEQARQLAQEMVRIGRGAGRRVSALITNMDIPLGYAIGNALEVIEAAEILRGRGDQALTRLCVALSAQMMALSAQGSIAFYEKKAEAALQDGSAFQKLRELVRAQGGDDSVLEHPERFPQAKVKMPVLSPESGFIIHMDAELIGRAAMLLGAGRVEKEGAIDPAAGIVLRKKTGDFVHRGETVAQLFTNLEAEGQIAQAAALFLTAIHFSQIQPVEEALIYNVIGENRE